MDSLQLPASSVPSHGQAVRSPGYDRSPGGRDWAGTVVAVDHREGSEAEAGYVSSLQLIVQNAFPFAFCSSLEGKKGVPLDAG